MTKTEDRIAQVATETLKELHIYGAIRGRVLDGSFDEALAVLKSGLQFMSKSTATRLGEALRGKDKMTIDRVFNEMDMRISQALCYGCWPESVCEPKVMVG